MDDVADQEDIGRGENVSLEMTLGLVLILWKLIAKESMTGD